MTSQKPKKTLGIDEVTDVKLLGLTIDTSINWKTHISTLKTKLSQFVYALCFIKRNTGKECALSAYYAYAHSWVSYGIILWGNSVEANDVFIMQKKYLRIIVNIQQLDSCKLHFQKNKILTLPSIYISEIATYVKKNTQNNTNSDQTPGGNPF